jgi:hypothetical protein
MSKETRRCVKKRMSSCRCVKKTRHCVKKNIIVSFICHSGLSGIFPRLSEGFPTHFVCGNDSKQDFTFGDIYLSFLMTQLLNYLVTYCLSYLVTCLFQHFFFYDR